MSIKKLTHVNKLLEGLSLCSYFSCGVVIKTSKAIWDNDYEFPYCSVQHRNLDAADIAMAAVDLNTPDGYQDDYPFDDPRSDGYVSQEEAQENYLLTTEPYDYDR